MRLLGIVEYDGTDFAGFQLQVRGGQLLRTVQVELERVLATCTGEEVRVIGSGRTDTGVHARGQAIHFDTASPLATNPYRLMRALNGHLPEDVKIRGLREVPETFHARYSATRRRYCYRVYAGVTPSPLFRRTAHQVRARLDPQRMNEAGRHLEGAHDFIAFAAHEGPGSTVRRVYSVRVAPSAHSWAKDAPIWHTFPERAGNGAHVAPRSAESAAQLIEIEVEASGFLRHMMRRIAGTLIRVGDGRLAPGDVASILASRDKALAGPTAPARGLCLEEVTYGEL